MYISSSALQETVTRYGNRLVIAIFLLCFIAFHQSMLLYEPDEFSDVRCFYISARIESPYQSFGVEVESMVSFSSPFLLDEAQEPG